MLAKLLQSCLTLCGPVDCSPQAPLSMGFSRQEYWSGLPCRPPGDRPDPEIEPVSLMSLVLAGRFFTTSATESSRWLLKTLTQESSEDIPCGVVDGNPPANAGDVGSVPGPGGFHVPQSKEACEPQLLSLQALEPMHHKRSLHFTMQSNPCPPAICLEYC